MGETNVYVDILTDQSQEILHTLRNQKKAKRWHQNQKKIRREGLTNATTLLTGHWRSATDASSKKNTSEHANISDQSRRKLFPKKFLSESNLTNASPRIRESSEADSISTAHMVMA